MNGLILEIGIIILKQLKKSNILIVGYGSIGKKYCKSASNFFEKKKIHIFSKHLKKNSLKKIKKIQNLDYIILSNRASDRIKSFRSLVKKKTTYIFEKPISSEVLSKFQKKNFLNIVKRNKIKIKTGYCLRLNPAVIKLKKILKNRFNKIISIKMNTRTYLPSWRETDYTKSVSAKKKYGGGVINELSHELDLMLYLFGKPKALFAKYFNSKSLKIDVEDVVDIIFTINKKVNLNMHLDFCSPFEKREIEILFKDNTKVLLDLKNNLIQIKHLKKTNLKKFFLEKNFYVKNQIKKMIEISKLKKNNEWVSEFSDSLYVLYIIKKIKESNSKDKLVKLSKYA